MIPVFNALVVRREQMDGNPTTKAHKNVAEYLGWNPTVLRESPPFDLRHISLHCICGLFL